MRIIYVVGTLVAAGFIAVHLRQGDASAQAQAPRAAVPAAQSAEDAIRQSAKDFTAAFDSGDSQAVAALWTSDGDYADESGQLVRGRDRIAAEYSAFFASHPGVKIKIVVDCVRLLDANVAVEDGSSKLEPAPDGSSTSSRYTAVHVKRGGKWLLASVRESRVELPPHHARLQALDWLIGTWESEGNGPKVEITCRWIADQSFIEVTHLLRDHDRTVESARDYRLRPAERADHVVDVPFRRWTCRRRVAAAQTRLDDRILGRDGRRCPHQRRQHHGSTERRDRVEIGAAIGRGRCVGGYGGDRSKTTTGSREQLD